MKSFFKNSVVLMFLLCSFVIVSPAQAIDEAGLKTALADMLGGKDSWVPKVASSLKAGMTCDQVKAVYADLADCDATKEYSFANTKGIVHPLLQQVDLTFTKGALTSATLVFKGDIDRELFKKVSLEAFQAKWGAIDAAKQGEDILTVIGPNYISAQRTFITYWQLSFDFPQ